LELQSNNTSLGWSIENSVSNNTALFKGGINVGEAALTSKAIAWHIQ